MMSNTPDWLRDARAVFDRLEELNRQIASLGGKVDSLRDERISRLEVQVARLEVKSGLYGGLGGLIAAGVIVGAQILGGQ